MNAGFSRRGACPALTTPMRTGDGLLVRLNPVAGGLSSKALIGLCESAARHGNGIMEVTARGSIQVRGLTASSAALLAGDVTALGIEARAGVPVETGPLAGLDPDETADPRPLAAAIRAAVAKAGLPGRLGPKVSVVVDGGGRFSLDGILADVRLTGERANRETAWRLAIGGDAATAETLGLLGEADACDAAVAILHDIAALGREGRARDLDGGEIRSRLRRPSSAPSGHLLPVNGEKEKAATLRPDPFPPFTGRRSRQGDEGRRQRLPLGVFPLTDTTRALAVALPFGSMPADTIAELARQAAALGAAEIRPAPGRTLLCLGLAPDAAARLQEQAAAAGFVTLASDPRLSVVACPGAPACSSAHLPARRIAEQAAAAGFLDGSFTLHVSGCAKGCAHPGPATLTLVGGGNGAGLVVDGTAKALPAGYASRYEAARGLGRVAALAAGARREDETAAACLARLGGAAIIEAFARK